MLHPAVDDPTRCPTPAGVETNAWQDVLVKIGMLGTAIGCALLLTSCSEDPAPVATPPVVEETLTPVYDDTLEAAATALALVPVDAPVLVVTDFVQLRLQLGLGDLTGESPGRDRRRFWRLADRDAVLLSDGILRGVDRRLRRQYDFSQDDVVWEARFATAPDAAGATGEGYVLRFRDDLDLDGVQRAIDDGVGPLDGAAIDPDRGLVGIGAVVPEESMAADPDLAVLVGVPAATTYVDAACLPADVALVPDEGETALSVGAELTELDELGPFSVSYGAELVTVRLGPDRPDTFDRARLVEGLDGLTTFEAAYLDPVADPGDGRIGYTLGEVQVAEQLARERRLPFAVCAG